MSFNTLEYILFFLAVVCAYYILPNKCRNPLLLAASYFFYAVYDIPLVAFLLLCTLATYGIGLLIAKHAENPTVKKRWLIIGIVLNLGVLCFYKYLNFFSSALFGLFGREGGTPFRHNYLVPLGISFILFQTLSYIIDVYKGKIQAEKSLFKIALYVAFFPKVVQGPIERAGNLLPQFDEVHSFNLEKFREGMLMVFFGLFMKMVIADRAAIIVDSIYGGISRSPGAYSGAAAVFATIMFAIQLYCDFAGYSLTAIGSAKVFGYEMKRNFRQPYFSQTIGEFWRRWHMSLNSWLTEYLYIPLGGSRCSRLRSNMNTLITFGLSGLWHGAAGGYIIWGLLNGVYVVIEKWYKNLTAGAKTEKSEEEKNKYSLGKHILRSIRTFVLICITWIFFRAQTMELSMTVIDRIVNHFNLSGFVSYVGSILAQGSSATLYGLAVGQYVVLGVAMLICFVVDVIAQKCNIAYTAANAKLPIRWTIMLALLFVIIIFGIYGYGYSASAFIYNQF